MKQREHIANLTPRFLIPILFFSIYLLIGLSIHQSYGISWDEISMRKLGAINALYMVGQAPEPLVDSGHGPAYMILLFLMERIVVRMAGVSQSADIYFIRHLLNFLYFYMGVIFFYFLGQKIFRRWQPAFIGAVALVLSPRIFENSFYNPTDIPLMIFFIVSAFSLFSYLEKRSYPALALHALACAVLFDIRITGGLMAALTFMLIAWDEVDRDGMTRKSTIKILNHWIFFFVTFCLLVYLFWPALWSNPIGNLINEIKGIGSHGCEGPVLFMGRRILSCSLPWFYVPVWILITTPVVYSFGFLLGAPWMAAHLIGGWRETATQEKIHILTVLTWFFAPLLATILLKTSLYDSWRHLFFIYPAYLIAAVWGFDRLARQFGLKHIVSISLGAVLLVSFCLTVSAMVRLHPYQQLFFNRLAGQDLGYIQTQFDLDYWGLSYREGLAYILKTDPSAEIPLTVDTTPGENNALLFSETDQKRLVFLEDPAQARYFIGNYRYDSAYPYSHEVFNVTIDGAKTLSVFMIR